MTITIRKRSIAGLAGAAITTLALLAPAASQATVPSGATSANWNVRHSWVDYVTNPSWTIGGLFALGAVTPTANTPATGDPAPTGDPAGGTSTHDGTTPYGYVFGVKSDGGSPRTVGLSGGLDFTVPGHSVTVTLKRVRVEVAGTGEKLVVDATFKPLTSPTQTRNDLVLANVSAAGAVTLTAGGAEVFNGGDNGSYSEDDAFGTVGYAAP